MAYLGRLLTEGERAQIVAWRETGMPAVEIAERIGCSAANVYRVAPGYRRARDEARIARIRELRDAGLSLRRVATMLAISTSTVGHYAPGYRARNPLHMDVEQLAQIQALRSEGHSIAYTAQIVGCSEATVGRHAPGIIGKVPNAPLREAFLASPFTAADVARELGWWSGRTRADSSRVKRTLGLLPETAMSNGRRRRCTRRLIDAETATLIAEAIGVAPWSVAPYVAPTFDSARNGHGAA